MTVGIKHDQGKLNWALMPFTVIGEIVKVLMFGANQYGINNWQKLENPRERFFSALMRHMTAWQSGEVRDRESGLSHLSHAGCNLIFLIWFEMNEKGNNG